MNVDFNTEEGRRQFALEAEKLRYAPDKFRDILADQLEYTRKKYRFTKKYYASLLDIDDSYYVKIASHMRPVPVTILINYCRIFNMDITGILENTILDDSDTVLREAAIYLSSLSDKTLTAIASIIENSDESERTKQHGKLLLEELLKNKR